MKLRVSIVLLALFSSVSSAENEEALARNSELALFLSAEDQLALEQSQAAAPSLLDTKVESAEVDTPIDVEEPPDRSHTTRSYRYDGIVMRNDAVLGLWFDGGRVSVVEKYTDAERSTITAGGRLQLIKGEDKVILYPGDSYLKAPDAVVSQPFVSD